MKPIGGHLQAILRPFGGHLVAILRPLGAILRPSWAPYSLLAEQLERAFNSGFTETFLSLLSTTFLFSRLSRVLVSSSAALPNTTFLFGGSPEYNFPLR